MSSAQTDLGFTFRASGQGAVHVCRYGRTVAVLRGPSAEKLLARAEGASPEGIQQLCARVTGNYRRGNEAEARQHPRNRRDA